MLESVHMIRTIIGLWVLGVVVMFCWMLGRVIVEIWQHNPEEQ